jgi:hypothetical protein
MRFQWLIGAAAVSILMQLSPPARAGLVGDDNSVAALFYIGAITAQFERAHGHGKRMELRPCDVDFVRQ